MRSILCLPNLRSPFCPWRWTENGDLGWEQGAESSEYMNILLLELKRNSGNRGERSTWGNTE